MTISTRLNEYLTNHNISYNTVVHEHSSSSLSTAIASHVPLNNLAKAVLLKDHEDKRLIAVLPANNKISLSALNENLNATYRLAKEQEVYDLFRDCEHGAVPPIAQAYGLTMVYDDRLAAMDDLYLEAGDHKTLIHLDKDNFQRVVENTKHCIFSREVLH